MAILTEAGRTAAALFMSEQPLHMAWGEGDPDWDTTPEPVDPANTALVAELGRLQATTVQFALPNPAGEVVLPEGNFEISAEPTKYLLLTFQFDYSHAAGETIREYGVFVGTQAKSSVAPGTVYLTPNQIENAGRMLVSERSEAFPRNASTRQKFTFVIQF